MPSSNSLPPETETPETPTPAGARHEARVSIEQIVHRAQYLPPEPRALANAYFALGMDLRELAALHRQTPRQMRRRLQQLRKTLTDPAFLLAALYADNLPPEIAALAKAYWLLGTPIRTLAVGRARSIHYIRRRLADARSLLLLQLANDRQVPPTLAQRTLAHGNRARNLAPTSSAKKT